MDDNQRCSRRKQRDSAQEPSRFHTNVESDVKDNVSYAAYTLFVCGVEAFGPPCPSPPRVQTFNTGYLAAAMSDPLSVISAVVGTYSACCEIFRQIQSIRNFHRDAEIQVDLVELQAHRVVLWGEGHKIRQKNVFDASNLVEIQEEKYLDKVLALFQEVKALFNKYGIRYEDPSSSDLEKDPTIASNNDAGFRSSSKTAFKKAMVPIRRLQWGITAKEELRIKCDNLHTLITFIYEVWPLPESKSHSDVAKTDVTKELRTLLVGILGSQKPAQLAQIERWLSLDELRFNPHQDLETYTKILAPNSCRWIEDNTKYKAWRDPASDHKQNAASILWITGAPGYGKSLLCASLIQKLKLETSSLAFFFSTKHAQAGRDINFVLRFWLQQLAEKSSETRELMLEFCSRNEASTRSTNDEVWELFQTVVQKQAGLTFVVDGIDEYYRRHDTRGNNDEHQYEQEFFMSKLVDICTEYGRNVHLLVVSRLIRTVKSRLAEVAKEEPSHILTYTITGDDVFPDIRYLARSFIAGTFPKFTTKQQDDVIDEMVRLSEGSFLWIDSAKKRMRSYHKPGKLFTEMRSVPVDLQKKYKEDLTKIIQVDPYRAYSFLTWILLAKEPLTIWEMCQITAVQVEDAELSIELDSFPEPLDDQWIDDNILPFCGDLIVVQENTIRNEDDWLGSATLSLLHPSVSDYLLPIFAAHNTTGHHQRLFLELEMKFSAHLHIAMICFAWLINDDIDIELTVERPLPSAHRLKDYALDFWHVHLEESPDHDKFPLQLLLDFFQTDNDQFVEWAIHFEKKDTEDPDSQVIIASPLYYAASLGLGNVVEAIIEDDPSQINLEGGYYGSALIAALENDRLTCFQQLLQKGADPDLQTEYGCALLAAVRLRAVRFLDILLGSHADAKVGSDQGTSALHVLASSKGERVSEDLQILRMLLGKDIDINARNAEGETPLISATISGHVELVKTIISYKGADLDAVSSEQRSAIYEAARLGQTDIFEVLLKAGAAPLARLRNGWTPFACACSFGHYEIVKSVIAKVVDTGSIDVENDAKETPIFLAALQGHADLVKLLLNNNAEHLSHRGFGITPLNIACANGHLDIVQTLLTSSAIQVNDRVSDTPLFEPYPWTTYFKHDDGGSTSLILAAKGGHESIVKALLEVEAIDILATDVEGNTALHHAAACGSSTILQDLLDRVLPGDLPKQNRNNPLHHAIRNGHLDVTRMLLEKGFDISISDRNKKMAIEKLARNGQHEILRLLIARWKKDFDAFWCHPSTNQIFDLAFSSHNDDTMKFLLELYAASDHHDNEPDYTNWTPLAYDIMLGNQPRNIILLAHLWVSSNVPNIDHYNGDTHTTLHAAAFQGKLDAVKQLLDMGANPMLLVKPYNQTVLQQAIMSKRIELVEMLLIYLQEKSSSELINFTDKHGFTPIHQAIIEDAPDILRLLLKHGADATCNTTVGSPLYQAALSGSGEAVKILLAHLQDIEKTELINQESTVDAEHRTPLFAAITHGHFKIASNLIEQGADFSTRHGVEHFPIIHFAIKHGAWRVVELICTKDDSVLSLRDASGATPLMIAARYGQARIVSLLLNQQNKTLHMINHDGRTAFHIAATYGHARIVRNLLRHDASALNAGDLYGSTMLSFAARRLQKEVVELLMKMPNIDYDVQDTFGKDVISWLVTAGLIEKRTEIDKSQQLSNVFGKLTETRMVYTLIYCNICILDIKADNNGWHCKLCSAGCFDICQQCRDAGAYCYDRKHELQSIIEDIEGVDDYQRAFRRRATQEIGGNNLENRDIDGNEETQGSSDTEQSDEDNTNENEDDRNEDNANKTNTKEDETAENEKDEANESKGHDIEEIEVVDVPDDNDSDFNFEI